MLPGAPARGKHQDVSLFISSIVLFLSIYCFYRCFIVFYRFIVIFILFYFFLIRRCSSLFFCFMVNIAVEKCLQGCLCVVFSSASALFFCFVVLFFFLITEN